MTCTAPLSIDRHVEATIEGFYGPEPATLDQRFAVYSSAALARGIWALGDVPEDVLVKRALRRIASVR